jgi:hypothetical protein
MALIITKPRSGSIRLVKESAVGTPDGTVTEFETMTGKYYPGTLSVFFNGVRERNAVEGGGKKFYLSPAPRAGSKLDVEYVLY